MSIFLASYRQGYRVVGMDTTTTGDDMATNQGEYCMNHLCPRDKCHCATPIDGRKQSVGAVLAKVGQRCAADDLFDELYGANGGEVVDGDPCPCIDGMDDGEVCRMCNGTATVPRDVPETIEQSDDSFAEDEELRKEEADLVDDEKARQAQATRRGWLTDDGIG